MRRRLEVIRNSPLTLLDCLALMLQLIEGLILAFAAAFAAFAANGGHVLTVAGDSLAALSTDVGHVLAVAGDGLATPSAEAGHVFAVAAHRLAALASRVAGLVGAELVGGALLVGGSTATAGNFALFLGIH